MMIALGAIKEAFKVYRKNKVLWRFTLLTVATYVLLLKIVEFFSDKLEFYGHFNFGTFLLGLLFFSIIETGLIQGVDRLRSGKEVSLTDIYNLLWQSGKHLPFIYIFLMIILGASFVFLSPFLCFPSAMMTTGNMFDTLGVNMFWFSVLLFMLFYFFTPLISRYFILRGGTYWKAIVEGSKTLVKRYSDTLALIIFFVSTMSVQLLPPILFAVGLLSWFDEFDMTLRNISLTVGFAVLSPLGLFIMIPMVSFFLLWWSATLTLYFQEIQEAVVEKPKWIRE